MTTVQVVEARHVKPGQFVRDPTDGRTLKVLTSGVDDRTASATVWEIVAYAEGRPTRRFYTGPAAAVEVVE